MWTMQIDLEKKKILPVLFKLFSRLVNDKMTALLKFFLAIIAVNCVKYGTHYVRNILGVSQVLGVSRVTMIATN